MGVAWAVVFSAVHDEAAPSARAADIATGSGVQDAKGDPRLETALLATHPGAELTSLFLIGDDGTTALAPVATFGHLPDATVRAAVIPGKKAVLATADVTPTRDASFNAGLFYLRPHMPPERLVDRIVHASRPLVTAGGRVFVCRGEPGVEIEGRMRVDRLTIDEIDIGTGRARTVGRTDGHLLFLAGALDQELIVYRVLPGKADIVAIQVDTGQERFIAREVPAFARDFSIDRPNKALVFQNRHETDSSTWVIERIDVVTGKSRRLFSSSSMTLAPFALPRGDVLFNGLGNGLSALEGRKSISGPMGAGVDVVAAVTEDGRYLAVLHTQPSQFAVPFVVDTQRGSARVLPAPPNTRVVVAGFVEEGSAP